MEKHDTDEDAKQNPIVDVVVVVDVADTELKGGILLFDLPDLYYPGIDEEKQKEKKASVFSSLLNVQLIEQHCVNADDEHDGEQTVVVAAAVAIVVAAGGCIVESSVAADAQGWIESQLHHKKIQKSVGTAQEKKATDSLENE